MSAADSLLYLAGALFLIGGGLMMLAFLKAMFLNRWHGESGVLRWGVLCVIVAAYLGPLRELLKGREFSSAETTRFVVFVVGGLLVAICMWKWRQDRS